MSKKATYRFNEKHDKWLEDKAKGSGTTKNDVIRELINKAMESEAARHENDSPKRRSSYKAERDSEVIGDLI